MPNNKVECSANKELVHDTFLSQEISDVFAIGSCIKMSYIARFYSNFNSWEHNISRFELAFFFSTALLSLTFYMSFLS